MSFEYAGSEWTRNMLQVRFIV